MTNFATDLRDIDIDMTNLNSGLWNQHRKLFRSYPRANAVSNGGGCLDWAIGIH